MPAYNSQAVSNSPLQMIAKGDPASVLLFNAETPATGAASIAVALQPSNVGSGGTAVSIQLECTGGIGSGVFQIQDSDVDVAADYTSINFGGATPGVINSSTVNASGVARIELTVVARFLRVLCTTTPGAAVTVRVRQN